jgi:hypothetical protein
VYAESSNRRSTYLVDDGSVELISASEVSSGFEDADRSVQDGIVLARACEFVQEASVVVEFFRR